MGRNRTEWYDQCVLLVRLEVQETVKAAKEKDFKNDFNRLRGSLRCLHRKGAESQQQHPELMKSSCGKNSPNSGVVKHGWQKAQ